MQHYCFAVLVNTFLVSRLAISRDPKLVFMLCVFFGKFILSVCVCVCMLGLQCICIDLFVYASVAYVLCVSVCVCVYSESVLCL